MIDTVIVSGGNIRSGFALDFLKKIRGKWMTEKPYVIAADKGLEFFINAGLLPDTVIGDFDSLSAEGKHYLERLECADIIRLKPEKDDSDTQSASKYAMKKGSRNILIFGATGSRLDHVFANLELLCLGQKKGVRISLVDEHNFITLVESGTILKKAEQFGKYVSFFPIDGDVTDLNLTGFQYPLVDFRLSAGNGGLTVSNEICEETAEVTFSSGRLLMMMTRD